MTEHEWTIEGRDVFIERWDDNGLETITKEEAELRLNEYETLKKATERLSAEDAEYIGEVAIGIYSPMRKKLQAYADILDGR